MIITATELKTNLGKYLDLASEQDIYITKNGRNIARLTSPATSKISVLDSLVGILPPKEDSELELVKEERLTRQ